MRSGGWERPTSQTLALRSPNGDTLAASKAAAMKISLLGLVEASHEGQALPLGGASPGPLLATRALHANDPVSADRLIEGLWGEQPPATAPKLVQVLVSQLRKN